MRKHACAGDRQGRQISGFELHSVVGFLKKRSFFFADCARWDRVLSCRITELAANGQLCRIPSLQQAGESRLVGLARTLFFHCPIICKDERFSIHTYNYLPTHTVVSNIFDTLTYQTGG